MTPTHDASQRGATLAELMIALVVLTLGILALAQVFPAGSRGQLRDRMTTTASYYAQEKIEQLQGLSWLDPQLAPGTHAVDSLGDSRAWRRQYVVETMAAPLDNLKRVTVTVSWRFPNDRQVRAVTYVRR